MFALSGSSDTLLHAADYKFNKDPQAYIFEKIQSHNLVMLGTRHIRQTILELISSLITKLYDVGVTHLGLAICSDQQGKIDNFLQTGDGLSSIEIYSHLDCPEYPNLWRDSRKSQITEDQLWSLWICLKSFIIAR